MDYEREDIRKRYF